MITDHFDCVARNADGVWREILDLLGESSCGDVEVGEGTGRGRAHKLVGFIERFKGASEKAECY